VNIKLYFAIDAVLKAVFIRTLGDTMEVLVSVGCLLLLGLAWVFGYLNERESPPDKEEHAENDRSGEVFPGDR